MSLVSIRFDIPERYRLRTVSPVQPGRWVDSFVVWLIRVASFALRRFGYRGLWGIAKMVGRLAPETQIIAHISARGKFSFLLSDPYWSPLVDRQFRYEPEIHTVLERMTAPEGTVFLDCGANYGYWSVVLSEKLRTIAIEPSPDTFRQLLENWNLNQRRFSCVNKAVHSSSGKVLRFDEKKLHVERCVSEVGSIEVATTMVDELTLDAPAVLIKLDVEGAEIEALRGAVWTWKRSPTLVIYEDHGRDRLSLATRHVLAMGSTAVYFSDEKGRLRNVGSATEATAFKVRRTRGYNFFATQKGSVFDIQLQSMLHKVLNGRPLVVSHEP